MSSPAHQASCELVGRRVAEADPALAGEAVAAAVDTVACHPAVLRNLARALADGPGPLMVGAPPTVGRLVTELRARGSSLPLPVCVRCGRSDRELTASAHGGVCPRCRRRQLACACVGCGVIKPVAGRDTSGAPLCAACAPRPQLACSVCGRVRAVARRAHDGKGPVCNNCYKGPLATCGRCGRHRPCNFAAAGRPICMSCGPRRTTLCAHCGHDRPPCARWPEGPVCEPCYRAALDRRGVCVGCDTRRRLVDPPGPSASRCADCAGVAPLATCDACGTEERLYRDGCCVRCALERRARQLIADIDGPLGAVYQSIVAAPQPYSTHNWLRSATSAAILADIAAGRLALSHEALDAHRNPRAANYLRHILVAHDVLAARDDAMVRLEAWVNAKVADVDSAEHRRLLRSYATWRVLRRARQRSESTRRPPTRTARAKTCLLAAIAFLAYLDTRGISVSDCSQADIDTWLDEGPPSAREIADFVDWATSRKLFAHLAVPSRPSNDGPALDDDTRWAIVQRLLHDDNIELGDRVAGCLVLLYGQQISHIVTIGRDQITVNDGTTRLQLGATHINVPDPLDQLITRLTSNPRPKTGVITPPNQTWLFPGLDPGQHLNAAYLGHRLRRLGIATMPARRAALMHLASRLPAAVLADLLGIHPTTAVHWVTTAGGNWTTYAAHLIRDRDREP